MDTHGQVDPRFIANDGREAEIEAHQVMVETMDHL